MNPMKKVKKLLHPPKWIRYTVPPVSFGMLWYLFASENTERVLAYPIYCMSAYALVVLLAAVPTQIKQCSAAVRSSRLVQKAVSTAFGRKYLTDLSFRGNISIWQGMTANFLYVLFRIAAGIRYASVWFLSMAAYYLVLGILRAYLVHGYHKSDAEKCRCYHCTAWLLFLLNIPMGGIILQMILNNSGFFYPEYIIYLSAIYTFYTMILAVVNLVKFRRLGDPVLSAAKVLNFVSAMMSVLGLQTAMIAHFSEHGENFRKQMNMITGGIVYGAVIGIAVYMLLHSRKHFVERKPS